MQLRRWEDATTPSCDTRVAPTLHPNNYVHFKSHSLDPKDLAFRYKDHRGLTQAVALIPVQ